MSKQCFICRKRPQAGNNRSHSLNATKRMWYPNLQKVKIVVAGKKLKEYVCTKCLKAGKIRKAA